MNSEELNTRLQSASLAKQTSVSLELSAMKNAASNFSMQLSDVAANFARDTREETQRTRATLEKIAEKSREDRDEQMKQLRQELTATQTTREALEKTRIEQAEQLKQLSQNLALQQQAMTALAAERAKTTRVLKLAIPIIPILILITALGTYYSSSSQTTIIANRALAQLDSTAVANIAASQLRIAELRKEEDAIIAGLKAWRMVTHSDKDGVVWVELADDPQSPDFIKIWPENKAQIVRVKTRK